MSKPLLICFPYAGGSASFFDFIEKDLDGIDLLKLEYSGHGERHKEPFYDDFDQLSADLFQIIQNSISGDYGLFGYSMGSISAAEVLNRIIENDLKNPVHVFLAAHEPHTRTELRDLPDKEIDDWVKRHTIDFGAVPERLVDNRVYWRTYLPLYRADYSIIDSYSFENLKLETEIPTTVFYSETDTPFNKMRLWEKYFVGDVEYHEYAGNHFFIQEHHKEMAEIIRDRMMKRENK